MSQNPQDKTSPNQDSRVNSFDNGEQGNDHSNPYIQNNSYNMNPQNSNSQGFNNQDIDPQSEYNQNPKNEHYASDTGVDDNSLHSSQHSSQYSSLNDLQSQNSDSQSSNFGNDIDASTQDNSKSSKPKNFVEFAKQKPFLVTTVSLLAIIGIMAIVFVSTSGGGKKPSNVANNNSSSTQKTTLGDRKKPGNKSFGDDLTEKDFAILAEERIKELTGGADLNQIRELQKEAEATQSTTENNTQAAQNVQQNKIASNFNPADTINRVLQNKTVVETAQAPSFAQNTAPANVKTGGIGGSGDAKPSSNTVSLAPAANAQLAPITGEKVEQVAKQLDSQEKVVIYSKTEVVSYRGENASYYDPYSYLAPEPNKPIISETWQTGNYSKSLNLQNGKIFQGYSYGPNSSTTYLGGEYGIEVAYPESQYFMGIMNSGGEINFLKSLLEDKEVKNVGKKEVGGKSYLVFEREYRYDNYGPVATKMGMQKQPELNATLASNQSSEFDQKLALEPGYSESKNALKLVEMNNSSSSFIDQNFNGVMRSVGTLPEGETLENVPPASMPVYNPSSSSGIAPINDQSRSMSASQIASQSAFNSSTASLKSTFSTSAPISQNYSQNYSSYSSFSADTMMPMVQSYKTVYYVDPDSFSLYKQEDYENDKLVLSQTTLESKQTKTKDLESIFAITEKPIKKVTMPEYNYVSEMGKIAQSIKPLYFSDITDDKFFRKDYNRDLQILNNQYSVYIYSDKQNTDSEYYKLTNSRAFNPSLTAEEEARLQNPPLAYMSFYRQTEGGVYNDLVNSVEVYKTEPKYSKVNQSKDTTITIDGKAVPAKVMEVVQNYTMGTTRYSPEYDYKIHNITWQIDGQYYASYINSYILNSYTDPGVSKSESGAVSPDSVATTMPAPGVYDQTPSFDKVFEAVSKLSFRTVSPQTLSKIDTIQNDIAKSYPKIKYNAKLEEIPADMRFLPGDLSAYNLTLSSVYIPEDRTITCDKYTFSYIYSVKDCLLQKYGFGLNYTTKNQNGEWKFLDLTVLKQKISGLELDKYMQDINAYEAEARNMYPAGVPQNSIVKTEEKTSDGRKVVKIATGWETFYFEEIGDYTVFYSQYNPNPEYDPMPRPAEGSLEKSAETTSSSGSLSSEAMDMKAIAPVKPPITAEEINKIITGMAKDKDLEILKTQLSQTMSGYMTK